MAKTKSGGASRLGRDAQPKYLGVKLYEGESVRPGMIIVRQRGTKIMAGNNVRRGEDDTLYAVKAGLIKFRTKQMKKFDGSRRVTKIVDVESKQIKA